MKTRLEIKEILDNLPADGVSKFFGMTYEQGIEEALRWVLEEMPNEEFEYSS